MTLSHDANIYELIFEDITSYENGDELPGIWVTSAVYDSDNRYLGHTYTMPYTGTDDPDGEDALFYGGCLYDDGMMLADPEHANTRLDCFRAADAGVAEACYKLGDAYKNGIGCDIDEQKAYASYRRAGQCDDGRAPYQTGSIALRLAECLENGIGCEHDFGLALGQYERAERFLDAAVSTGDWYYKRALHGARDGITRCKQETALGEGGHEPQA